MTSSKKAYRHDVEKHRATTRSSLLVGIKLSSREGGLFKPKARNEVDARLIEGRQFRWNPSLAILDVLSLNVNPERADGLAAPCALTPSSLSLSARSLYQGVRRSVWDPETSREQIGD